MGIQINTTVELEVYEILIALMEDSTELCYFVQQFASGLNDGVLLDNVVDLVAGLPIVSRKRVAEAFGKLATSLKNINGEYTSPPHLPGMPCWLFEYDKDDGTYGIVLHGTDPQKIITEHRDKLPGLRLLGLHGGMISG